MNRYSIVQGADDPNAFLRGLNRESFNVDPYRRKVVGLFGEQERADPQQRYRLPETFSAEALSMMDPVQLERLLSIADRQYDTVEQNWRSVTPNGYTGIYATEDGPVSGPDPGADPENQRRAAALQAIQEAQGNIKAALAQREQARLRNENQLLGGVAELGYDFAPGSLNDAAVRSEIWDNRDRLPQYLRGQALQRRIIRGPGDTGDFSYQAPRDMFQGVEEPVFEQPYAPPPMEAGVFDQPPVRPRTGVRVFEPPKQFSPGMELRPGVRVRNPFDVNRVGPRPSRSMFS